MWWQYETAWIRVFGSFSLHAVAVVVHLAPFYGKRPWLIGRSGMPKIVKIRTLRLRPSLINSGGPNCNVKPHHLIWRESIMPLARKIRKKKKNFISVFYFALFRPDHYDNKLQAHLTLVQACIYKGKISSKSSSLLSIICYEIPLRTRIRAEEENEIAWNCRQWKNQTGIVHTSFWVHGHPHSTDFETRPCCQCSKATF